MTNDPHIPSPLGDDLRKVYRSSVPVPKAVDAALLAAAAGRAEKARRGRRQVPLGWRVTKWVGVAAAVVLALVIPAQFSQGPQPVVLAGDFNRDGAIDIMDAFALARAQRDGDSTISRAEVDAAAARAVRLNAIGGGA